MRSQLGWILAAAVLLCGCSGLPRPGPMPPGQTFAGRWSSSWGEMKLMVNGKRVFGPYRGIRNGSISGEQDGDLLTFHWLQKENQQSGHGYLRISPDGSRLEGRFGYLRSYDNGGLWTATRRSDSESDEEP